MTPAQVATNATALRNLAARLERMGYTGDCHAEAEHNAYASAAARIRAAALTPAVTGAVPDRRQDEMPYMLADTREEFERVRDLAGRRLSEEAARIADRRQDERAMFALCDCGHPAVRHAGRADYCAIGSCSCARFAAASVHNPDCTPALRESGGFATGCPPCEALYGAIRPAKPAVSPVPSQQREAVRDVLRQHHPIMRSETGPFSGCRCGQVRLGQDVIAHVTDALLAATRDGEPA